MHRKILDLKALGMNLGNAEPVKALVVQVDHFVALVAYQVMVAVRPPVESGGNPGMMQPPHEAHVHQGVESPVDGGPRDARNAVLHRFQNLIRGRVVVVLRNGLEHGVPLR